MLSLFASKIEKILIKARKKEMELLVRYVDSSHYHKSKVLRVDPDKFLFSGFAETLREDVLELRIPALNTSFETRVTHMSHDLRGNVIYHSPHPKEMTQCYKVEERHFVYPRVRSGLAWEVENGTRKLELFVWDVTKTEMELVNSSEEVFMPGQEFLAAKIQAGQLTCEVDLRVKYVGTKQYGKQLINIVGCEFTNSPEKLPKLIEACARIDND